MPKSKDQNGLMIAFGVHPKMRHDDGDEEASDACYELAKLLGVPEDKAKDLEHLIYAVVQEAEEDEEGDEGEHEDDEKDGEEAEYE